MSVREVAFALYGRRAGLIVREGGAMRLVYDDDYLASAVPTPLSLSMPLTAREHGRRVVVAYLKGLLPDHADVRERWARIHGVRPGDTLGLVAAIGRDTAGAAIFAAPDELDDALSSPGHVESMAGHDVADRLRNLRGDDSAWQESDEHWSLAGGQCKFAVVRTANGWGVARGSHPSTHIIKPGISRIRAQALTEHVSMRTLARLGLEVARTQYVEFEDQPAIVVERYDRRRVQDGSLRRIHQEDMVQTFGMDPSRKYEADRGPGVRLITERLRAVAELGAVDRFVQATIANYLLGAPDGHAKNFALLLVGSQVRFAPLFDVSTGLVADSTGRLRYPTVAQSIGGEKRFGEVEARHWERFAGVTGLAPDRVREDVRSMARAMPDAMRDALAELPAEAIGRDGLLHDVLPRVSQLAEQTLRGLDRSHRSSGRAGTWFGELQPTRAGGPGQPASWGNVGDAQA